VSLVDTINVDGDDLKLKRQTDSGWEIVSAKRPVVVSITNDEHNVPRIPKTRDVMMSFRQQITQWSLDELDIDAAEVRAGNSYYEVVELFIPIKESHCEFVTGDSLDDRVDQLARKVAEVTRAL
jgi:electron transfer flavoprotein beta subunit